MDARLKATVASKQETGGGAGAVSRMEIRHCVSVAEATELFREPAANERRTRVAGAVWVLKHWSNVNHGDADVHMD